MYRSKKLFMFMNLQSPWGKVGVKLKTLLLGMARHVQISTEKFGFPIPHSWGVG